MSYKVRKDGFVMIGVKDTLLKTIDEIGARLAAKMNVGQLSRQQVLHHIIQEYLANEGVKRHDDHRTA